VLDYCVVVIQVTVVDKDKDKIDPNFVPLSDRDKLNMDTCG